MRTFYRARKGDVDKRQLCIMKDCDRKVVTIGVYRLVLVSPLMLIGQGVCVRDSWHSI